MMRGAKAHWAMAPLFLAALVLIWRSVRGAGMGLRLSQLFFFLFLAWGGVMAIYVRPWEAHVWAMSKWALYLLAYILASRMSSVDIVPRCVLGMAVFESVVAILHQFAGWPANLWLTGNPGYSGVIAGAGILSLLEEWRRSGDKRAKLIIIFLAVLFLACLWASRSRTAALGVALALMFTARRRPNAGEWLFWGAVAAMLAYFFYSKMHVEAAPFDGRVKIWRAAWAAFLDRPLGWGFENFEKAFLLHQLPSSDIPLRFSRVTRFAHNEPLQLLVESGFPGFLLMAGAIAACIRSWPAGDSRDAYWKGVLLLLGIHALFNFIFYLPIMGVLFFTALGRLSSRERPMATCGVFLPCMVLGVAFFLFSSFHAIGSVLSAKGRHSAATAIWPYDSLLWGAWAQADGGLRALDRALELDPENAFLLNRRARLGLAEREAPASVLQYFADAERWNPRSAAFQLDRALFYRAVGDVASARAALQAATQLEPLAASPLAARGALERAQGNRAAACRFLAEAVRNQSTFGSIQPPSNYASVLYSVNVPAVRVVLESECGNRPE